MKASKKQNQTPWSDFENFDEPGGKTMYYFKRYNRFQYNRFSDRQYILGLNDSF